MRTIVLSLSIFLFAATAQAASLKYITPDPAGYGYGFARPHVRNGKIIVFFGNSHNPWNDNSVREYDPSSNSWTYLLPKDSPNALHNRDDFASFYIPAIDKLLVWNGAGLEQRAGSLKSGVFNFDLNVWETVSTEYISGITDIIAWGGQPVYGQGAYAWNANIDMGVSFGGGNDAVTNNQSLYQVNSEGPQPYKKVDFTLSFRPSPRTMCFNCLVAANNEFYLFGGVDPFGIPLRDFWKFFWDGTKWRWTQAIAQPGSLVSSGSIVPIVTYDSIRNTVNVWNNDRWLVYDIATNVWTNETPAGGIGCLMNAGPAYAVVVSLSRESPSTPTSTGQHFYFGGNDCFNGDKGKPAGWAVKIQFDVTAPGTQIKSGPKGTLSVDSASFTWVGSDNETKAANLQYAYRLDPIEPSFSPFGSATSKSYTGLTNGNYVFYVKALDQEGNEQLTPASRSFTVSLGEIIIDNAAAGQTSEGASFTGTWCGVGRMQSYGTEAVKDCGAGSDTYRWTPTIPSNKTYDVYARWASNPAGSTSAPYAVTHAGGTSTVFKDQSVGANAWQLLGTFNFNAGTAGYVELSDQNGQAVADAVRWVPVP